MTQEQRVIDYLKNHKEITPREAYFDLGIMNLARVVSQLIHKRGYQIYKTDRTAKNKFGEKCRFKVYSLTDFADGGKNEQERSN